VPTLLAASAEAERSVGAAVLGSSQLMS